MRIKKCSNSLLLLKDTWIFLIHTREWWEAKKRAHNRSTDTPYAFPLRCTHSFIEQILCQYISAHLWKHSCFLMSKPYRTVMISSMCIIFSSQSPGYKRNAPKPMTDRNVMSFPKLSDSLLIKASRMIYGEPPGILQPYSFYFHTSYLTHSLIKILKVFTKDILMWMFPARKGSVMPPKCPLLSVQNINITIRHSGLGFPSFGKSQRSPRLMSTFGV